MDYTVKHFKDEEKFMEQHGFPGLAAHKTEHILLLQEAADFQENYNANPASVRPIEVARFLGDWLTHHIQQMDFTYATFIKAKGGK